MNRTIESALVAVVAISAYRCMPADARADGKPTGMTFVAAGDTVKPTFFYKITGNPDSVVCIFSGAGSTASRKVAPGSSTSCGPGILLPVPVMVEGDSAQFAVNWTIYKRNAPNVQGGPYIRWYKRPVTVPNLIPDSLNFSSLHIMRDPDRILMDSTTREWRPYAVLDTVGPKPWYTKPMKMCVSMTFKDNGKIVLRDSERADTVCTRLYAKTVGQLQRWQPVSYNATTQTWTVGPGPLSAARMAALNKVCISWSGVGIPGTMQITGIVSKEQCDGGTGPGGVFVASAS